MMMMVFRLGQRRWLTTSMDKSILFRRPKNLLGSTVAATAMFVTGSLLAWPVADVYLGPKLAQLALMNSIQTDEVCIENDRCNLSVLNSVQARNALEIARQIGRPVCYLSLATASSPHDLLFAVVAGIYSTSTLGVFGVLSQSMGIWWIMLFDILVSGDHATTRAVNLSLVLNHLRRALENIQFFPLIIFDHFDLACQHANSLNDHQGQTLRRMLFHIGIWASAQVQTEKAAVIIGLASNDTVTTTIRKSIFSPPHPSSNQYNDPALFHNLLRVWLYK
mmetsp:Transcript_1928/g.2922  ORF Transcript_1928/g.2922 Transcript_1928/m.2922 type:complete len:278 (+) Transcript_1928:56-889(+)